ncbi:glutathione synthase [Streptomyces sp. OE57]|uniref:glutathione synthase n=1 Tax=Streptomyces lacaronensis TaxID=3379885 RepID=UPI0039B74A19
MVIVVVMGRVTGLREDRDTSLALMRAAASRGHEVWHCRPGALSLVDGRLRATGRPVRFTPAPEPGPVAVLDLHTVDAVLVRSDPPFDSAYLAATLLLERLRGDTLVLNDPRGLREANEKLYACHFPACMPPTLVTADREQLLDFAVAQRGAVLKPLFGHGGRGVVALMPGDRNAPALVEQATHRGERQVMAQAFLPEVSQGDKRILLLDGEPLGAILRRPAPGDFRANIGVGADVLACALDPADLRVIERIGPRLRADGLWLVGIDVIGGRLTEVNVTSPTGLVQLSDFSGVRHDLHVVRALEARVRDTAASRATGGRTA